MTLPIVSVLEALQVGRDAPRKRSVAANHAIACAGDDDGDFGPIGHAVDLPVRAQDANSLRMNAVQQMIDDVRARFGPKVVITDRSDVEPWLTDWRGRFHGAAEAILAPSSTEEVAEIVRLAAEHRVPLVPQGGNTGMVGGATAPEDGSALVLSLRRMNRIRSIDSDNRIAIAEAGVILAILH
jgi:hypothetical protein